MGSLSCSFFSLLVFVFSYNRAFAITYGVTRNGNYYCSSFLDNYAITWGDSHISTFNQGKTVQLSMDESSGSGFGSKLSYSSGSFRFRMKLTNMNSIGVIAAFYLTSHGDDHDELDFEFLGNKEGFPNTLQTNVFVNGVGGREQSLALWFDPTEDYHSYKILWNPYQIVFYVDNTPIRVYKNKTNIGVDYPTKPMQIEASIWNAESWAGQIDWHHAPFTANFRGFNIDGCSLSTFNSNNPQLCSSSKLWWNRDKYKELNPDQERAYQKAKGYIIYDYCKPDFSKPPPECPQ